MNEKVTALTIAKDNLEILVENVLKMIEENDGNWLKSWRTNSSAFKNHVSGKSYTGGINIAMLIFSCWLKPEIFGIKRSKRYVTFNQAKELNWAFKSETKEMIAKTKELRDLMSKKQAEFMASGKSNKNEETKQLNDELKKLQEEYIKNKVWEEIIFHTTNYYSYELQGKKVYKVYYKVVGPTVIKETKRQLIKDANIENYDFGNIKTEVINKYYNVAPVEYFDGYEPIEEDDDVVETYNHNEKTLTSWDKLEKYLVGENISIRYGGEEAYYDPSKDSIVIPNGFYSEVEALSTTTHEAIHSTGHEKRLNRNINNFFGTDKYAKEELVAEMGSLFFLLDENKADEKTVSNCMAYLKCWIKKVNSGEIKNNLVSAINSAKKAVDFICKYSETKEDSEEDVL